MPARLFRRGNDWAAVHLSVGDVKCLSWMYNIFVIITTVEAVHVSLVDGIRTYNIILCKHFEICSYVFEFGEFPVTARADYIILCA